MEIWKDIIGYEGYYQVSNHGNIRSIDRFVNHPIGGAKSLKRGTIKKQTKNIHGYPMIRLSREGINITRAVHLVVAEAFLGHRSNKIRSIVVDHIDNNKENNYLSNLQVITHRENNTKDRTRKSGFPYVSKCKNKWRAACQINHKKIHIGLFNCPTSAHFAALKTIANASI